LEMPGPARYHGTQILSLALTAGRLSQFTIDERVRELLTLIDQCAASGVAENAPEETRDTPETAALLRQLATDAIVLLKNENHVLPLSKSKTVSLLPLRRRPLDVLIDMRRWLSSDRTPSLQPTVVVARLLFPHIMPLRRLMELRAK
jgi:beta-glucosidase-like glycosyl hydrolase